MDFFSLRTHMSMIPVLKRLHLTNDRHQTSGNFEPKTNNGVVKTVAAPVLIQAVPRLGQDLCALGELMDFAVAPCIQLCPTAMAAAGFIFGDASGMGFGQSLWLMGCPDVNVFFGLWDGKASGNSSKWREFYNQVLIVECCIEHSTIPAGTEIFVFTDKFVMEWAIHWGISSNKTLFIGPTLTWGTGAKHEHDGEILRCSSKCWIPILVLFGAVGIPNQSSISLHIL
jgi:hypothetical protein